MRIRSKLMKMLVVLFVSIVIGSTVSVPAVHADVTDGVTFMFEGTAFNNQTIDTEEMEKHAHYLERALKTNGKNVAAIEEWYDLIEKPHSYPLQYTFMRKGDGYRKILYAPPVTMWFDEFNAEFIRNGENSFAVVHTSKNVILSNRPSSGAGLDELIFDPVDLLATIWNRDSSAPASSRMIDTDNIKLDFKSPGKAQELREFIANKRYNFAPARTLLISPINSITNNVWIAKMSDFKLFGYVYLPTKYKVKYCRQSHTEPLSKYRFFGVKYLAPSFEHDITGNDFCEKEDFLMQWDLELKSVSFEALPDETFWPDTPEEYVYQDTRDVDSSESNNGKGKKEVERGHGPHVFKK